MTALLDEIKRYREEVNTDSYTTTWREIINLYRDGDIVINPEYQRLFRWSIEQQTQFIESLMLNIPTPALFFAVDERGRQEVMDGLQRISTVLKFFSSEIDRKAHYDEDDVIPDNNNITIPTVLVEGPLITSLVGHSARSLPENITRSIKNSRVPVILLESESSVRTKHTVFRRLNRAGSELSDQEIRNCTARLLGDRFPIALRALAKMDEIKGAIGLKEEKIQKMDIEELLLRLLALDNYMEHFKGSFRSFLDDFMDYASDEKFSLSKEVEEKIIQTFSMIQEIYNDGDAFRFQKEDGTPWGAFSPNIFDVVAIGAFRNLDNLDSVKFKSLHQDLIRGEEIRKVTGAGSNAKAKILARVKLGTGHFSK